MNNSVTTLIIMGAVMFAVVDPGDVHTMMIGAAGVGKTACFLYPNLEYACASGMSFLSTDKKATSQETTVMYVSNTDIMLRL